MLRLFVALLLALASCGIARLWVRSYRGYMLISPLAWEPKGFDAAVDHGVLKLHFQLSLLGLTFADAEFSQSLIHIRRFRVSYTIAQTQRLINAYVPIWACFAVACIYPLLIYPVVPLRRYRRWRRRKRNQCVECGYPLTGLIDPRCPECGCSFQRVG